MRAACGLRASQSAISARMAPRLPVSPGSGRIERGLPVTMSSTRTVLRHRLGEQPLEAQMRGDEIEPVQVDPRAPAPAAHP